MISNSVTMLAQLELNSKVKIVSLFVNSVMKFGPMISVYARTDSTELTELVLNAPLEPNTTIVLIHASPSVLNTPPSWKQLEIVCATRDITCSMDPVLNVQVDSFLI